MISREADYNVTWIGGVYRDNTFSVYQPEKYPPNITCGIYLITWEDYYRIEGGAEPLEADEVFAFSSSKDLGVLQKAVTGRLHASAVAFCRVYLKYTQAICQSNMARYMVL